MIDYKLYLERDETFIHQPYSNELSFYTAVKRGDLNYIQEMKEKYAGVETYSGKGELSDDPVRNELYHFIVNVAVITRNCIEGGLGQEIAYTMSDAYIHKADKLTTVKGIQKLNDDMVWNYTSRMKELRTTKVVSQNIMKCINYIYDHLNQKITIMIISRFVSLDASYVSILFKKETGMTVHAFITQVRLETAESMLVSTDYTYADISASLAFSSQSHFIQLFKKKYGMTPAMYRTRFAKL